MTRLSLVFAALVLLSLPLSATEVPPAVEPEPVAPVTEQQPTPAPELPLFGTPEPLNASSCRAVAMAPCDNGSWMVCEGTSFCDYGWKWVICDNRSYVCPECAWGAACL